MTRQRPLSLNAAFLALISAFLAAALALGCATQPQTFNDKVAAVSATITATTLVANDLAKAGRIDKKSAQNALAASTAGSAALTTAQQLNAAGDATGAAAQLAMATTVLEAVKAFLISQGGKF